MVFGLAIRAPWKGRIGLIGMPIVSTLIAANTIAIFVLAFFNASAVELGSDVVRDRAHLTFFWCTVPFLFSIATTSEIFCLWTDRLTPLWAVISSTSAISIWVCELILWQFCIDGKASYCPPQEPFFKWYKASISAPVAAIPSLIILYILQLSFAALVVNRQRRYAFRVSDMSIPWERKSFDDDDDEEIAFKQSSTEKRLRTMSVAEQERMLENSPTQSARSERGSLSSWPSFSRFSGTWQ